jgi:hydrogenase 3 maturation protease
LNKDSCNIQNKLRKWFRKKKKIVVAGIGNPIRSDDFVGLKIVQDLRNIGLSKKVFLLECETVPENFMQEIIDLKPSHVILIDAAFLGLKPGETRLVFPKQIADFSTTTSHVLPLRIFCDYISQMIETKIALLLIEPENTDFGEGLTPKIETVAKRTVAIFREILS